MQPGQLVSVHLNLTTKRFVVATKPKGAKLADADCVTLTDVTFKVSEAQRLYCVSHGARWVHAWALGQLVSIDEPMDTAPLTEVTYNPFRAPTFHVVGREQPVYAAPLVHFANQHGYIEESA